MLSRPTSTKFSPMRAQKPSVIFRLRGQEVNVLGLSRLGRSRHGKCNACATSDS